MSEFDNLKDDAEQYAQQHPQQIREGEDAAEKKFGIGQQDQGNQGQGHRTRASTARASRTSTARASRTSTARASRTSTAETSSLATKPVRMTSHRGAGADRRVVRHGYRDPGEPAPGFNGTGWFEAGMGWPRSGLR